MRAGDRSPEERAAARWLGLAIGSLLLAGSLSLLLVIGRMPPFDRIGVDPLFFRRCLVVHVDLALVAWFYAFACAMLFMLSARGRSSRVSRVSPFIGAAGIAMMVISAGVRGAEPVLANYVPMIAHPGFGAGLVLFGAGVIASFLDARIFPDDAPGFFPMPAAVQPGLRATALAIVLAAITFATSYAVAPDGLAPQTRYELSNWGGGHVLQFAIACALGCAWILLVGENIARRTTLAIYALAVLPWLAAPLFAARGVQSIEAREWFTRLMQFAIFPMQLALLVVCVRALKKNALRDPRTWGFLASALLCVVGWGLGAAIRGPTTMVPAHYHASIGAVTAAFMTLSYPLLSKLGYSVKCVRVARVQPIIYGVGQLVFAGGFAFASAPRKIYASEQHARTLVETIGLFVMGAGGLVAVIGGLTFLFLVISAWKRGRHGVDEASDSEADGQPVAALGARDLGPVRLVHDLGLDRAHQRQACGAAVKGGA